jgi:hypothetical protein
LRALTLSAWLGCSIAAAADEPQCPSAAPPLTPEQLRVAQKEAPDRGFLWRVTKQGRSSYPFGTLHVGKPPWSFPGPNLRAAQEATDTLALEVDLTDSALLSEPPAAAMAPMVLPEAIRARLLRQIAAACTDEQTLRFTNPLMQAIVLTLLAARWDPKTLPT